MKKYTKKDAGCWLDGARGNIAQCVLVQKFAKQNGWPEELELDSSTDIFYDVTDDAIEWMNLNLVDDSVSFAFYEGDFGLYENNSLTF